METMRHQTADTILQNIAIMLQRRGLTNDWESITKELRQSFNQVENSASLQDPAIKVKVHFDTIKTMGKIQDVVQFIQQSLPSKCILVVKDILSRPFKELIAIDNVEIYWMHELINDIASNTLIPHHRKLGEEEKQRTLKEYGIVAKNLPKLDKTDFVVRYMGFQVHDVIEIQRASITSGVSVVYRVVVNCSWDKLFA